MVDGDISRREILANAGAGMGALTLGAGSASAREPGRYNVGTASPAAERAARGEAERAIRVLEWGNDDEKTITGIYTDEAIDGLRNRPDIRYIEKDGEMRAVAETLPWGVDRVDADVLHDEGETGNGADIAIIDTGIDDDHPDLQANVGAGKAYVDCRGPNCNYSWSDDNDHGTHCSGIADAVNDSEGVVGVSTEATLHAVKVLDKNGSGSYSDVAAGIEYVADQGWDVGSLSLGGEKSNTVEDAVEYAYKEGVLLVAAAGNDGSCTDCVGYPAAEPEVIAVSATSEDDSLASFSSTGSEIELAAPGEGIYSTVVDGYDTLNGTSMACPHVTGAGGQLMANGYDNTEARTRLQDTAEDIGLADNEQGYGLLDAEAAVSDESSNSAPSVSWITPDDGETVSGTITVQIDASDSEDSDDSLTVEWSVDDGSLRTAVYNSETGYYEDSWDTTGVSDGEHTFEAYAEDSAGNTSTATISITTENTDTAPSVSWVTPADGDTVSGSVDIVLDADDDRDSGSDLVVEWSVDDGSWHTASFNSDTGYYDDTWDTTGVSDGDRTLDARATDTSGNASSEASASVTVDNTSSYPAIDTHDITEAGSPNPHLDITVDWGVSDTDGDLSLVRISAEDSDGSAFSETNEHSVSGSSASGTDEFSFKHVDDETADVTIYVEDAAGNSASYTDQVSE